MTEPYLSIIFAARNDNHYEGFMYRFQNSLNILRDLGDKHRLSFEIIIVEWNPLSDMPQLKKVLSFRKGLNSTVRIVTVPPEIHKNIPDTPFDAVKIDGITFYEYFAKNAILPVDQLHIQYNPDRFEKYKSLHKGPSGTVLEMHASPHCRLLEAYERDGNEIFSNIKEYDYYKMQRFYGKSHKAAVSKTKRLVELYENVKNAGFNTSIVVVDKPIIENEYNSNCEIYTGHHRVACCIQLGIKSVPSEVMKVAARIS